MSAHSTIEWTDATWNPIRGCTKISPGCTHCYAETFAERFRGVPGHPYEQGFDLRIVREKWTEPCRWGMSRMVFANSMSDLFHRDVDDETIVSIARVMVAADWHTFQILTKRSERMRELLQTKLAFAADRPHLWWGVSVEDRKHGLPRVTDLRKAPAGLRMLSVEPLLEDLGTIDLDRIGWVILGGESGSGARPLDPLWVASIRDQCLKAGVPFFFKQWGGTRKGKTGRSLGGRTHDDVPARPESVVPSLAERRALISRFEAEFAAETDHG
jgi:protein gp37